MGEMIKNIRIESKIANLGIVENEVDSLTREAGISRDNYGKILVSVMEAVNNAIIHGNKSQESKIVEVNIKIENNLLEVTVTDEGHGFKPGKVPDPTKPENIENVNGRGIFLMKKLTDEIEFNKKGNMVRMTFKNILT
ncbi:MAG: ATP-binding protein [Bacteroidales bacterium]|nr:ATP-binding protein [Bacteroidales bacterium]